MIACFVFCIVGLLQCNLVIAAGKINQSVSSGLAIHGYDPVAYFEQGQAEPGDRSILYEYQGVNWAFSSEDNKQLFLQTPQRYIPQYGGYCSYAASRNYVSDADPTAWQIVGGKLYLNYNNRVQRTWASELDQNIKDANTHWPNLSATLD